MATYGRYPLVVVRGRGTSLFDADGKEYLDFAAGIATCTLGHSNEKLKQAIVAQMDKVQHCSNLYFIPEQAALAKWLVQNSCMDKAFFCNSGAEVGGRSLGHRSYILTLHTHTNTYTHTIYCTRHTHGTHSYHRRTRPRSSLPASTPPRSWTSKSPSSSPPSTPSMAVP
jgi:acetylornithine/succinyldiaminopimelate/putrescine aminotransferase